MGFLYFRYYEQTYIFFFMKFRNVLSTDSVLILFVFLIQTRVTWDSVEEWPSSDWPVGMSVGLSLG